MTQDLERLRQTAIKYQEDDEEVDVSEDEMNEERAYHILGISPNLNDEQIKEVFRKLAKLYHPDHKYVEDSSRFREIREAYDFLKSKRGFK